MLEKLWPEPQVSEADTSKLFVRLKNDLLSDVLSATQFIVEEYNLWDHDPIIHIYQNIDGKFYSYISWRNDEENNQD